MNRLIVARNVVLVVAPIIFITGQRDLAWSYLFSLDNQFFILYWLWIPSALWWLIGKDEKPSEQIKSNPKPKKISKTELTKEDASISTLVFIVITWGVSYIAWEKYGEGTWFYVGIGVGALLGLSVASMLDDYFKNNPRD